MLREEDTKKLDGLLYPSVAGQLTGYNTVIKTDFVDNNLKIRSASMYRVVDFIDGTLEYRLVPIKSLSQTCNRGKLIWKDVRQRYADKIWYLNPQTPTEPYDEKNILPVD